MCVCLCVCVCVCICHAPVPNDECHLLEKRKVAHGVVMTNNFASPIVVGSVASERPSCVLTKRVVSLLHCTDFSIAVSPGFKGGGLLHLHLHHRHHHRHLLHLGASSTLHAIEAACSGFCFSLHFSILIDSIPLWWFLSLLGVCFYLFIYFPSRGNKQVSECKTEHLNVRPWKGGRGGRGTSLAVSFFFSAFSHFLFAARDVGRGLHCRKMTWFHRCSPFERMAPSICEIWRVCVLSADFFFFFFTV